MSWRVAVSWILFCCHLDTWNPNKGNKENTSSIFQIAGSSLNLFGIYYKVQATVCLKRLKIKKNVHFIQALIASLNLFYNINSPANKWELWLRPNVKNMASVILWPGGTQDKHKKVSLCGGVENGRRNSIWVPSRLRYLFYRI